MYVMISPELFVINDLIYPGYRETTWETKEKSSFNHKMIYDGLLI